MAGKHAQYVLGPGVKHLDGALITASDQKFPITPKRACMQECMNMTVRLRGCGQESVPQRAMERNRVIARVALLVFEENMATLHIARVTESLACARYKNATLGKQKVNVRSDVKYVMVSH